MIPKTLSASSLQVAELCLDRWSAEYMHRGRGLSNSAADTGTAVHGGCEKYVEAVYIHKTHERSFDLLVTFYQMSYVQTFNSTDMDTPEFNDGYELIKTFYSRTNFDDREVESVERKEMVPVPFNHPEGPGHTCENCAELKADGKYAPQTCFIPFNYIMDRVDKLDETIWEVVDYKTIRVPIQPEDLNAKIQARAYALAIQIKHPEATKIKVTFDLLRHEKVSMWFTREDNIRFWNYLCATVQRLVDTDEATVEPRLNAECGYCVKKATCKLLQKNIAVGGLQSKTVDEMAHLAQQIRNQNSANSRLLEEIDDQIMRYAHENDVLEWETDGHVVEISVSRRRNFRADEAARIMGPELFAQMGNMTIKNLESIIKDPTLDHEMRMQLKELLHWTNGNLGVKVKPKPKTI